MTTRKRTTPTGRQFLRPLGIVGYDALEPALLAALATEAPLLLLGDHGSAKTWLLLQLAAALQLEFRHYNASLLQFDDLVGFPIPDPKTGAIRYASPPGAIWGAEAVFIDEIGRCRPETANKLFPIVHERRIQGIELTQLRFRWAATNPPVEALDLGREEAYEGVERLDAALADRFAFVIAMPTFDALSDLDRLAVIEGCAERPSPDAYRNVRELVASTRDIIAAVSPELRACVGQYVLALVPRLREAQVTIGGRRAAMLTRNVIATYAAHIALGRIKQRDPGDSFLDALLASIPDRVRRVVSHAQLLAAHQSAWEQVTLPERDPLRILLEVRDPVRRALLAATIPNLTKLTRGEAICGALGGLSQVSAAIVAWHLLPRLTLNKREVPATTIETVVAAMDVPTRGGTAVRGWGATAKWIADVRAEIAVSNLPAEDAEFLSNAICTFQPLLPQQAAGYSREELKAQVVAPALETWRLCTEMLGSAVMAAA